MTTTTVESFFLLQEQFDASYSEVNWTLAIPPLGLAIGPLLFTSLADTWGRRPILIVTCALSMLATGCTTIQTINYDTYMFFRFLQGIGAGPAVVVGFAIIGDISFEHERGFGVGLWVLAINAAATFGIISMYSVILTVISSNNYFPHSWRLYCDDRPFLGQLPCSCRFRGPSCLGNISRTRDFIPSRTRH
jgi:MFS family permease